MLGQSMPRVECPFLHPAQSYKPRSLLDQNRKNDGSKKGPKVRKHGVSVFGQARVSARGGGGGMIQHSMFSRLHTCDQRLAKFTSFWENSRHLDLAAVNIG